MEIHYEREKTLKKILPMWVNYSRIFVFQGGLGKEVPRRGRNDCFSYHHTL